MMRMVTYRLEKVQHADLVQHQTHFMACILEVQDMGMCGRCESTALQRVSCVV